MSMQFLNDSNTILTIISTVFLGVIAIVELVNSYRRRKTEEKSQDLTLALDILKDLSTYEVSKLVQEKPRSETPEYEFLVHTQLIAIGKQIALSENHEKNIDNEILVELKNQSAGLDSIVGNDKRLRNKKKVLAAKHGVGQGDRSKYSWNDEGSLPKYETLQHIALRFVELNNIRTQDDFDTKFGAVVKQVLGESVDGKSFNAKALLIDSSPTAKKADQKRFQNLLSIGALQFEDGPPQIISWSVGYGSVAAIGRAIHLPLIEHFSKQPGYNIAVA